ncbi:MAG: proton-conducting transporter membrane subunit, partial [Comamonas sp.]
MSVLAFTERLMPHLMLAPVLLPMLTAALMLILDEKHQRTKLLMNIASCTMGLVIAIALVKWSNQDGVATSMSVYLSGNWAAPFGISLVLDRLSALMILTTSVVALCAVIYSGARWHRAGVHFHPLFQFQLMGLCGAFLTGDLFNLFVFFEIMLAASYGLLLHGSGKARVQTGLHYIAINLVASFLILIGVSMLYGITGTLNMADLARIIPSVSDADRGLLHTAA